MHKDRADPRLQPMAYIHHGTHGKKGRLAEVLAAVPGTVTVEYCNTLEVVALAPWRITREWRLVRAAPRGEVTNCEWISRPIKAVA